jgi:hypothetical protein
MMVMIVMLTILVYPMHVAVVAAHVAAGLEGMSKYCHPMWQPCLVVMMMTMMMMMAVVSCRQSVLWTTAASSRRTSNSPNAAVATPNDDHRTTMQMHLVLRACLHHQS